MQNDYVLDYFRLDWPTANLWRYSQDGEAIEWTSGGTVIFRKELESVIAALASEGLPHFGLIVLLMSACSSTQNGFGDRQELLLRGQIRETSIPQSGLESCISTSIVLLRKLSKIDVISESRSDIKQELAQLVFEDFPVKVTSPERAREYVNFISANVLPEELLSPSDATSIISIAAIEAYNLGLSQLDSELVQNRLRTGLDQKMVIPEEPPDDLFDEQELITSINPQTFLQDLEHHAALSGLARLTRHLMSVFHLPQSVSEQEELPVGGVTDVTNRGPLHRLLVSELANDDDILLTRLALNEALYLRREKPPSVPSMKRKLFIDCGLRMWGIPRVYATAFALATGLQATDLNDFEVITSRSSELEPVSLWSADGIQQHLESLEPDLHPGNMLQFLESMDQPEPFELILVSCSDVFEDDEFQQAMKKSNIRECYLVSVERDGEVQLSNWNRQGRQLLKRAHLDLDRFLQKDRQDKRTRPLIDPTRRLDLPAIFGLDQFPLRLSVPLGDAINLPIDDTRVISITSDCRLMLWDSKVHGAIQLSDQIPRGSSLVTSYLHPQEFLYLVLTGNDNSISLMTVDLEVRIVETVQISEPPQYDFARILDENLLLVQSHYRKVVQFDLKTGARLGTSNLPRHGKVETSFSQVNGYVNSEHTAEMKIYYAVSVKPNGLQYEPVIDSSHPDFDQMLTVFYSESCKCPVVVTKDGRLLLLDGNETEKRFSTQFPVDQTRIGFEGRTDAGDEIVVSANGKFPFIVLKIPSMEVVARYHNSAEFSSRTNWKIYKNTSERNQRKHISFIATRDHRLILGIRKRRVLELVASEYTDQLSFVSQRFTGMDDLEPNSYRQFHSADVQPGGKIRLHQAEWDSGAKAWIDRRGLLHLKSGQKGHPEVTLVLIDNAVSGWTSNGDFFGNDYFIRPHESVSSRKVLEEIIQPILSEMT